jgi:glycosyltransferase involved in cell wall biosynthesis
VTPVSVFIPAKNEEQNLPGCLQSLTWADEVFVVDSQSTDRTVEIAETFGARVVQFHFNGSWPKKKNWALENLPFRNEWILILDGDERCTPELIAEIQRTVQGAGTTADGYDGFYVNRKLIFLGRWIKHAGWYPSWNLRLFRHPLGRYENLGTEGATNTGDNEIHEHVLLKGRVGFLKHDLLHEDCRDIYRFIQRLNSYSNWEAAVYQRLAEGGSRGDDSAALRASLFGTPVERKRFLKRFWVHMPFRPMLKFFIIYILRLGFLDGKPGYIWCRLISQYEFQIAAKIYELQWRKRTGGVGSGWR